MSIFLSIWSVADTGASAVKVTVKRSAERGALSGRPDHSSAFSSPKGAYSIVTLSPTDTHSLAPPPLTESDPAPWRRPASIKTSTLPLVAFQRMSEELNASAGATPS